MSMLQLIFFGDESGISQLDLRKLHKVGFKVLFAGRGRGIEFILQQKTDVIVINKNAKGVDSLGLCNQIRTLFHIPVIIISDSVDEIDCVLGLEIGADDYITRPFSMDEFILRLHNILRRYQRCISITNNNFSRLHINLDEEKCRISLNNNELFLSNSEFILLSSLMKSPQRIFSIEKLCEVICANGRVASERSISGHIKNIKRKLSTHAPGKVFIRNVYGEGYYWCAECTQISS